MKLCVGNQIESLHEALLKEFQSVPLFEKKMILVPSGSLKDFLINETVQKIGIFTAAEIVCVEEANRLFFPQIPSQIELSLRLEQAFKSASSKEIHSYLHNCPYAKRGSLADTLASLFLRYLEWGKKPSENSWQKELWDRVFSSSDIQGIPPSGNLYLFHPGYLPSLFFDFYAKHANAYFLLSPCAHFWEDVLSPKGEALLLETVSSAARSQLEEQFGMVPPLLKTCGKLGKKSAHRFEDWQEVEELYSEREGDSSLHTLQRNLLQLQNEEIQPDLSIGVYTALNLRQEVEFAFDQIHRNHIDPSKVVIVAPNIAPYLPHIRRIFKNFQLVGLEWRQCQPLIQGLEALLDVYENSFSLESLNQLLSYPKLLAKFEIEPSDARQFISWGKNKKELTLSLAFPLKEPLIRLKEGVLLGKWIQILELLEEKQKEMETSKPFSLWIRFLISLIETFFVTSAEDAHLLSRLRHFGKIDLGIFEFETLERILKKLFSYPIGSISEGASQGPRFCSIESLCAAGADFVMVLGMTEGQFPVIQNRHSLEEAGLEEVPSPTDTDRWNFLELFLTAKKGVWISYSQKDPEDGSPLFPSPLVRTLFPSHQEIPSFQTPLSHRPKEPLFSPFPEKGEASVFEVSSLNRLSKNPLAYFLEKTCGIFFDQGKSDPLLLSPYEKAIYRRVALEKGLSTAYELLKNTGRLPEGEFGKATLKQLEEEIAQELDALQALAIDPSSLFSVTFTETCRNPIEMRPGTWFFPPIETQAGVILGRLENLTPQGMVFHGDETIATWPGWLMMHFVPQVTSKNLLLTKKRKILASPFSQPQESLCRFLNYASKAQKTASPLMPKWTSAILKGDLDRFTDLVQTKGLFSDPAETWLRKRQLFPEPKPWLEAWLPYLKEVFHEAF